MKKLILATLVLFSLTSIAMAQVTTQSYLTSDDVTIDRLESNRIALTNGINSADGSLIQTGTIPASALDDNANPENRWNEGFNDFVFTGLIVPTSTSLSATTTSGIAYINGTRVVKDATAKTYTASKWTWVDLSSTGVYTYQETAIGASEPSVSTNSIRLARVSTDATTVASTTDERVTQINIAAGSAGSLADTDADTLVETEKNSDEDILRFSLGDTTLSSAREVLTIQAIDASNVKIEPTTDNDVDLGSSTKEFKDFYLDGTAYIDNIQTVTFGLTFTDSQGTVLIDGILDEDSMSTNSAVKLATQQSIKAYVDTTVTTGSQTFTSDGNFTGPAGKSVVYVTALGGGGGGAGDTTAGTGCGGGGGSGGLLVNTPYAVGPGNTYAVVVGQGGAGGVANGNGSAGTASTFDGVLSAGGGGGGTAAGAGTSGAGGTVGAIHTEVDGDASVGTAGPKMVVAIGKEGGVGGTSNTATSGAGGGSIFGLGAAGVAKSGSNPGVAATNRGTGGSGAATDNLDRNGGAGANGIVIIRW